MARTKANSSQTEQSGKTGAGGELHQQPAAGGVLMTTNCRMSAPRAGIRVSSLPTTRILSKPLRVGRPC